MKRIWLLIIALALRSTAQAQPVYQLSRITPTTGLADSSLFLCADSTKTRTRACKFNDVQKRLAFKAFDSVLATNAIRAKAGTASLPGITLGNYPTTGLYLIGPDTIAFALAGQKGLGFANGPTLFAPARQDITISAGGGNNVVALGDSTTTIFKAGKFASGRQAVVNIGGAASFPALAISSTTMGLYQRGATTDTLGVSTGGAASLWLTGGASPVLIGGATGGLTVRSGVGNSLATTFQTTTSAGTAKNTLVLGADSSATFLGAVSGITTLSGSGAVSGFTSLSVSVAQVNVAGSQLLQLTNSSDVGQILFSNGAQSGTNIWMRVGWDATAHQLVFNNYNSGANFGVISNSGVLAWGASGISSSGGLTVSAGTTAVQALTATTGTFSALASEGSTQNAVCITSGGVLQQNAAASCLVSARRFKHDIAALSLAEASNIVVKSHPVTYVENGTKQKRIGLIAEEADSVDHRLAANDAKGRITSVNYEAVTIALLRVVQDQQRQLDSIKLAARKPAPKPPLH